MLVLQVFRWLLLAMEILIAGPVLYLCLLSISAILTAKKRKAKDTDCSLPVVSHLNFAVLIPAHDEIAVLDTLLESLADVAYSKDHYAVYVVADNCTDTTADLARATGWVHVYERFGYIGTALYLLRPPRTVYIALLHSPGFIIWKLWVYFVLKRSKKHTSEWVHTSRTVS